jgi:hypothetical protein
MVYTTEDLLISLLLACKKALPRSQKKFFLTLLPFGVYTKIRFEKPKTLNLKYCWISSRIQH